MIIFIQNAKICILIYNDRKQTGGCLARGLVNDGQEGGIARGNKETFRDDGYVHYLIVVMVSWIYTHVRVHQIYTLNMCHLLYVYYNLKEQCFVKRTF